MLKKEELFFLIQSLSKSEKRYFRIFCSRESKATNYLRLYDAIEKQTQYDERAIREQFAYEPFIKQLHVTKNYLRHLLLRSLRNFHANISRDAEVKDILRNVEILYHKELYQLCQVELDRAGSISREYELLPAMIEVQSWQRRLVQAQEPNNLEYLQRILEEQQDTVSELNETVAFWSKSVKLASQMMGDRELEPFEDLLTMKEQEIRTIEAKALFYNMRYLLFLQRDEGFAAEQQLQELISLLERDSKRLNEEPGLYVSSINNLLSYLVFNNRFVEASQLVQKANAIYAGWTLNSANRTLLKQILRTYNIELEIYRNSRDSSRNHSWLRSTENFLEKNVQKIPRDYLVSFWFQLSSIHFRDGNLRKALIWINKLLNSQVKEVRTDLQIQVRMLNLMVHLEQENLMVLRHYVDSTKRFMKRLRGIHEYEKILLRFFVKIGRLPLLEYRDAFKELRNTLFPEDANSLVPEDVLGYIDYREWIERKVRSGL